MNNFYSNTIIVISRVLIKIKHQIGIFRYHVFVKIKIDIVIPTLLYNFRQMFTQEPNRFQYLFLDFLKKYYSCIHFSILQWWIELKKCRHDQKHIIPRPT